MLPHLKMCNKVNKMINLWRYLLSLTIKELDEGLLIGHQHVRSDVIAIT